MILWWDFIETPTWEILNIPSICIVSEDNQYILSVAVDDDISIYIKK